MHLITHSCGLLAASSVQLCSYKKQMSITWSTLAATSFSTFTPPTKHRAGPYVHRSYRSRKTGKKVSVKDFHGDFASHIPFHDSWILLLRHNFLKIPSKKNSFGVLELHKVIYDQFLTGIHPHWKRKNQK